MSILASPAGPVHRAGAVIFMVFLLSGPGRLSVPPVSAQSPADISVKAFAQLPRVSDLSFSPDGKYFAMIRPINGLRHLVIQPANGKGDPVIIPPRDELEIWRYHWASNERLLVIISFEGWRRGIPTFETRLIGINRDGSNAKYLVEPARSSNRPAGKGSNLRRGGIRRGTEVAQLQHDIVDYLPDDPDHILLSVDADRDNSDELRRINIHTGRFTQLYKRFFGIQSWMTDRQGEVRFASGVSARSAKGISRTKKRVHYYRHADGSFTDFTKTEIYQQGYRPASFAENPDHVFMWGTSQYGTTNFVKYDLHEEKIIETLFEHEIYDAYFLVSDPVDHKPVGIKFFSDKLEAKIFDPTWAKRYRTINRALAGMNNTIVSSNSARTLHLILSSSDREPGIYYVYDEKAKKIDPLMVRYASIEPEQMAPMKTVSYEARDGLTIPAILTLPLGSDGKNLPTVVMPHGGPHSRSTMAFQYKVQFLASRGYAVLQPNFRGSTGFGNAFEKAGYQQWGLKMQDDVTDGTKWLIDQGIADPRRICIVGGSYGGYAALMGVVKEPELYACAISLNGVMNIPSHMASANNYIGGALGTSHINQEGRREVSPEFHAKSILAPVLLIAAKDDRNVDYKQSRGMARALKRAKKKYKYVEMKSGDHDLTTEKSRERFLSEMEAFLAEHIGRGS